jgi:hypothetical protein
MMEIRTSLHHLNATLDMQEIVAVCASQLQTTIHPFSIVPELSAKSVRRRISTWLL